MWIWLQNQKTRSESEHDISGARFFEIAISTDSLREIARRLTYLNLGVHWEVSKFGTESVRSGICGFLRIVLRVCEICTARPNLGPVRRLQPAAAGASAGLRTKNFFWKRGCNDPNLGVAVSVAGCNTAVSCNHSATEDRSASPTRSGMRDDPWCAGKILVSLRYL